MSALVPVHEPLAVQDVAFALDQLRVDDPPDATLEGEALNETVGRGACATVTVADRLAEPPLPTQVSEYVAFALNAPVDCAPDIAFVPDHAPLAEQELALVLDQLTVDDPPEAMLAGEAVTETVGAGELATVTLALRVIHPPSPQHHRLKVFVAFSGPTFADPTVGRLPDHAPDA